MIYDAIILGAGAAGLMCAATAGARGRRVLVLDHATHAGEKIRISGGGRCNFTNIHCTPKNFLSENPRFCISALSRYTPQDFIALVQRYNITYHEKTLGQLFCDHSSRQIVQMLLDECAHHGVTIQMQQSITDVQHRDGKFIIQCASSHEVQSDNLILATGGLSIPKMGATGFAYDVAKKFGLRIVPTRAGLVPFVSDDATLSQMKPLAGIAFASIATHGKVHFEEASLITHKGLSGPAILQISSYWREGDAIALNLAPHHNVATMLKDARTTSPKQEVLSVLSTLLPKRLAQFLLEQIGMSGTCAELSNTHCDKIAQQVHHWLYHPATTEGYRTAEVTLGGIDTRDLSSQTMEATNVRGLYCIGEAVDVTGHLGGFNFQWAWASGYAAGMAL
ncbi:MAG: NAD(P)/FAD-dependent oxidoreductase [Alphaproteobacteria bacterium]|nr:MAG: NAD(P)/FAD-dependent oxidoreductase [Alphaproteobacteria bacterium]TAF16012.1 MAG: NAD(P)/FAD-dependent oxidoreductase [Alphaproteobacteria bacterium]TAF76215.1 MAG: NAD(P)/FAD-dependent oxidoreductase [Alphaproteobacteria bacterium]